MKASLTKLALRLGGTLALCLSATAHAASAPEVARVQPADATSGVRLAPAAIIAADQRKTNLLKTASLIIVSDSDGSTASRRIAR